jgi:hypothetical protein
MYNEVDYWQNRMKLEGKVNASPDTDIHADERELIMKYIKPGSLVMDYGVGDGRLFDIWEELGCVVQGYDIGEFREALSARYSKKKYRFQYYHTLGFRLAKLGYKDNYFQGIGAMSVLTHCRPENVQAVADDIIRLGEVAIISAYDGEAIEVTEDSYCYKHDYDVIFGGYDVIEYRKINKMGIWVVKKR